MDINNAFNALMTQINNTSKNIRMELVIFPSGAVMLDVHCDGCMFVLAYSPEWGFGVDDDEGEIGLGTSFRYGFDDFLSAKEKLLSLLADKMSGLMQS
jgi:hypothetical protein